MKRQIQLFCILALICFQTACSSCGPQKTNPCICYGDGMCVRSDGTRCNDQGDQGDEIADGDNGDAVGDGDVVETSPCDCRENHTA